MTTDSAQDPTERRLTILLLVSTLAFLGVFAWHYAQERLYADSGYYLARVINEGGLRIEHGRWVLALAQSLALAGVQLGLPLKALVLLHSLSNVVWLASCAWFALRVLKARWAAIALVASHLIGLTHGLFCPVFELYYGVDLLILSIATIQATHLQGITRWLLLGTFIALAVSSHFFILLLGAGVLALEHEQIPRRTLLFIASLTAVVLFIRIATLSSYERTSLEFLVGLTHPERILSATHVRELPTYLVVHYADVTVLALITAVALFRKKEWKAFAMFTLVLLVLHVLTWLKLPGTTHDRYREQVNFASTAWVVIVYCQQLLPVVHWRKLGIGLLLAAALFRMVRAEWIAQWYAERTALIRVEVREAQEAGMSKAIAVAPVYFGPPHHLVDLSWSTSVESLLLSASEGPARTVSLITTEDLNEPGVVQHLDDFLFRRWDVLPASWLNTRYFTPPEGRYQPLPPGP